VSVPPAVSEAADRLQLPVLEIPRPTPFVAITRVVARAIAGQDVADKEFVLSSQRALTAAATGSGGTAAVLDEVARLSGGWGLLLDRTGAVLAAAPAEAVRYRAVLGADFARLRSAPGNARPGPRCRSG
jgi:PucR family transcriptional regulator, purine catabolism regulatory protein